MSNEAAERLRSYFGPVGPNEGYLAILEDALAVERRATVERIRAAIYTKSRDYEGAALSALPKAGVALALNDVADILDAEAAS